MKETETYANILFFEEDEAGHRETRELLEGEGYCLFKASSPAQVSTLFEETEINLVILFTDISARTCLDTLTLIRELYPVSQLPVILVGEPEHERLIGEAMAKGANDYVLALPESREILTRIRLQLSLKNDLNLPAEETGLLESLIAALNNMGGGLVVVDVDENIISYNRAAERIFGFNGLDMNVHDWLDKSGGWFKSIETLSSHEQTPLLQTLEGRSVSFDEYLIKNEDEHIWISVTGNPLRNGKGELLGGVITCRDISDRKRIEDDVLNKALFEGLTQLPNRPLLVERINLSLLLSRRNETHTYALAILNLDKFGSINESLGRDAGDKLLVEIGRRISLITDPLEDVVLAHLKGDEFALLIEGERANHEVIELVEQVQSSVSAPVSLSGRKFYLTGRMGLAFGSSDYENPEQLLRAAGSALSHAKKRKDGHYEIFDKTMQESSILRLEIEQGIRHGLERNEFTLHYQPIVSAADSLLLGFEALIRWRRADGTMISPQDFIPVAEECGLIDALGVWVLQEACDALSEWEHSGLHPLPVAINISSLQFQNENFTMQTLEILKNKGVSTDSLKLELTESIVMGNEMRNMMTLQELKKLGFRLLIDDFGTGYSSFEYLKKFPLDTLKIDKCFIDDVTTNTESAAIARAIIAMAHSLNLTVVAEGVETREQAAFLHEQNCDFLQGYYFSKPMPRKEVENFIREERYVFMMG